MEKNNPWQVDSVKVFSFLKCPECTFDSKEEDIFEDHAVVNHPLSYVLFATPENVAAYLNKFDKKVRIKDDKSVQNSVDFDFVTNEHFDDNFETNVENSQKTETNTELNCDDEMTIKEEFSEIEINETNLCVHEENKSDNRQLCSP